MGLLIEKFSYYYNDLDSNWKLTNNLHVNGSIQLKKKVLIPSNEIEHGQLIYKDDNKLHFINENNFMRCLFVY
jgi:translation elongation factor P/translation initiation factor 5A